MQGAVRTRAAGQLPIELWSLVRLYQLSQVNIATRACARVAKCSPSMTSRLNPEKNDSAMALSRVVKCA